MTDTFRCDDKEALVAYLYGELDPDARRQIEGHVRTCAACATEIAALQQVRQDLASWQPPEPELGFTIVQKPATVLRPSRWSPAHLPAWAQVAAAALVLGASAAIANVQVRYGTDGLTVSTGWMMPSATVSVAPNAPVPAVSPAASPGYDSTATPADDWRPAFAALEAELRRDMQSVRRAATEATAPRPAYATAADSSGVLRRMETMLAESEQRQRQELALRMTQFIRDQDMQRRMDLTRIDQNFGRMLGRTVQVEGNQRQLSDLVRRVSTTQVPQ